MRAGPALPLAAILAALPLVTAPPALASTYSDTIVRLDRCHGYLESKVVGGVTYVRGKYAKDGGVSRDCDFSLFRTADGGMSYPIEVADSASTLTRTTNVTTGWHWDGSSSAVGTQVCIFVGAEKACGGGY
jgi:hypothetical protein